MKRIIAHLKENWIKYGFETLVITAGILLAFGLNNWNENRKLKLLEIKLLKDLVEVSYRNNDDAISTGEDEKGIYNSAKIMKYTIENDLPYSDSIIQHIWALNDYTILYMDYSGYEAIKDQGLNIISNDSVRLRIGDTFNVDVRRVLSFESGRKKSVEALWDYKWLKGGGVPINFEELKKDPQFNLLVDLQMVEAERFSKRYAPPGFWLHSRDGMGFIPMLEAEIARLEGH